MRKYKQFDTFTDECKNQQNSDVLYNGVFEHLPESSVICYALLRVFHLHTDFIHAVAGSATSPDRVLGDKGCSHCKCKKVA